MYIIYIHTRIHIHTSTISDSVVTFHTCVCVVKVCV